MPYKRPMPDSLDAKVTLIKRGWTWRDEPFPYPSPGVCANHMHWEDEEGKPHLTPEWESKWWFTLLWKLQGLDEPWTLQRHDRYKWMCWRPLRGFLTVFFSRRNNPGGCVCQAYVAQFEEEVDASTD